MKTTQLCCNAKALIWVAPLHLSTAKISINFVGQENHCGHQPRRDHREKCHIVLSNPHTHFIYILSTKS